MSRPVRSFALASLSIPAAVALPAGASHTIIVEYVAGGYAGAAPGVGPVAVAICQAPGTTHPFGVGGACTVWAANQPGTATVQVFDKLGQPVPFFWRLSDCGITGTATGRATFARPAGCDYVDVYPAVGSPAGIVMVS